MAIKSNKISKQWIRETRGDFRDFLDETDFPDPERPSSVALNSNIPNG